MTESSELSSLTTEQKAGLTSGEDFWHTKAVGDIPAIMLTDGPHGLRKQAGETDHLGLNASVPATCFPSARRSGWSPPSRTSPSSSAPV
jgi:beta-glucosidase